MWIAPSSSALLFIFLAIVGALPATYALFLAKRALAPYRARQIADARTLVWHHLVLVLAFAFGGWLSVITFGLINLIAFPAAVADLCITTRKRYLEQRLREDAGLPATAAVAELPRAYVVTR